MPTTIHPSETIGYVVPWIASAGNTIDVKVSAFFVLNIHRD